MKRMKEQIRHQWDQLDLMIIKIDFFAQIENYRNKVYSFLSGFWCAFLLGKR